MTTIPGTPNDVDQAVAAFAAAHPDLAHQHHAHDRCIPISEEFTALLADHGTDAEVVMGARVGEDPRFPGVRLFLGGHYAVAVGDTVYDWTARQFNPAAPVPLVQPLEEWRTTWADPEEVL